MHVQTQRIDLAAAYEEALAPLAQRVGVVGLISRSSRTIRLRSGRPPS